MRSEGYCACLRLSPSAHSGGNIKMAFFLKLSYSKVRAFFLNLHMSTPHVCAMLLYMFALGIKRCV